MQNIVQKLKKLNIQINQFELYLECDVEMREEDINYFCLKQTEEYEDK